MLAAYYVPIIAVTYVLLHWVLIWASSFRTICEEAIVWLMGMLIAAAIIGNDRGRQRTAIFYCCCHRRPDRGGGISAGAATLAPH